MYTWWFLKDSQICPFQEFLSSKFEMDSMKSCTTLSISSAFFAVLDILITGAMAFQVQQTRWLRSWRLGNIGENNGGKWRGLVMLKWWTKGCGRVSLKFYRPQLAVWCDWFLVEIGMSHGSHGAHSLRQRLPGGQFTSSHYSIVVDPMP